MRVIEVKEITVVLLTATVSMLSWDIYDLIWVKLGMMIDLYKWTLHFDTCVRDLDFGSKSQGCEKA